MNKYRNRLRDLRQDKDLTQEQVAKIFFLQRTQYRRYENGESDLPLEWAKKFAEYYDVSIDFISGRTSTPKPPPSSLTARQKRLLEAYAKNADLQTAVDKLLGI